ncbi:MAG: DUF3169 family protein [Suipraeoptans sp.]
MSKGDKRKFKKGNSKGYLLLIILIFCGGVIGGIIGGLTSGFGLDNVIIEVVSLGAVFITRYYIVLMGSIFAAFLIVNLYYFSKMSKNIKASQTSEDEDYLDKIDVDFRNDSSKLSSLSLIFYSIAFIFFAACVSRESNKYIFSNSIMFLVFVICYGLLNIVAVNYYKKYDPTKKDNPSSLKFHKEWIKSSDESEQHKIYKAGWEMIVPTSMILIIGFCLSVIASIFYSPAGFAVIITGGMVIAYAIVDGYVAIKNNNENLRGKNDNDRD